VGGYHPHLSDDPLSLQAEAYTLMREATHQPCFEECRERSKHRPRQKWRNHQSSNRLMIVFEEEWQANVSSCACRPGGNTLCCTHHNAPEEEKCTSRPGKTKKHQGSYHIYAEGAKENHQTTRLGPSVQQGTENDHWGVIELGKKFILWAAVSSDRGERLRAPIHPKLVARCE
jgi:hypothetical protein